MDMGNGKGEEELLTVQDISRESGVPEDTIRRAIQRGRLAVVKKYGRRLIERQEWERYHTEAHRGRPKKQKEGEG